MIVHVDKQISGNEYHVGGYVCFGNNPAFKFTTEITREDLVHVFMLGYELGKVGDEYEIRRTTNGVPND